MNIKKSVFGSAFEKDDVIRFEIENSKGMKIALINYGATLQSVKIPLKNGDTRDIVLGFDNIDGYMHRSAYQGMTVGPVANRVSPGGINVKGKKIPIGIKNDEITLHSDGEFSFALWDSEIIEDNTVKFSIVTHSKDNCPTGQKTAFVSYTLTESNEIKIEYNAFSDKYAAFSLTNHSYFNLDGRKDILDTEIMINADLFTPLKKNFLVSGKILPTEGTPLDFRRFKKIGSDINSDYEQIITAGGYDHNFCINGSGLRTFAFAKAPDGTKLECISDMPCMQFYTANFMKGELGKNNKPMLPRCAFCFETQNFPDCSNAFPDKKSIYEPGEEFKSVTVYKVSFPD